MAIVYGFHRHTNLGVQIDEVRRIVSDPFDTNAGDQAPYVSDEDVLDALYAAEIQVASSVPDGAIPSLVTQLSRTTVNGTASYALPGTDTSLLDPQPMLRLLTAELNVGWGLKVCNVLDAGDFAFSDEFPAYRGTPGSPTACLRADGKIQVYPVPGAEAGAGKLVFNYMRLPRKRYRYFKGKVDSVSGAVLSDSDMTAPNAWWVTDCSSGIRMLSGALKGEDREIGTYSVGVFTTAQVWSRSGAAQDEYVAGELSDLPDTLAPLVLQYAAYLILVKEREDIAQIPLGEYNRQLQTLLVRYGKSLGGNREVAR